MAYPAPFRVLTRGSRTWRWQDLVEQTAYSLEDLMPNTPKVLMHGHENSGLDPLAERAFVNQGWEIERWPSQTMLPQSRDLRMVLQNPELVVLFCEDCRACPNKIPHLTHETEYMWRLARGRDLPVLPVRAPGLRTLV